MSIHTAREQTSPPAWPRPQNARTKAKHSFTHVVVDVLQIAALYLEAKALKLCYV